MDVRSAISGLALVGFTACAALLPDDLPSLVRAMASNDMQVHTEAARKVEARYGVDGFLTALQSPYPGAKVQAARFLRLHPDPKARRPLLEATHHPNAHVRGWAAFALSALPDDEVKARLRELTEDGELVVSNFAKESLGLIAQTRDK